MVDNENAKKKLVAALKERAALYYSPAPAAAGQ